MRAVVFVMAASLLGMGGCKKEAKQDQSASPKTTSKEGVAAQHKVQQVQAPFDVKNPPADAVKTPSGLIYKVITANPSGARVE